MPTATEPMVKGAAIREFFAWYETKYGAESVRQMARQVPDDLRALLDPDQPIVKLLAASWYPCRLAHSMLETLKGGMTDAAFGDLAKQANRYVVQHGTSSVYRFFLEKLVTPEMYAVAVPRLWRQLHTTGIRRMHMISETEVESTVLQWKGHHPLLCTVTIETMCAIFEQMGKRSVRWTRTRCVSSGASECTTRVTWM